MGKIARRILIVVLVLPCSIALLYFSFIAIAVLQKGYSWKDMDWNSDGSTSILEFFESSDIGERTDTENGRNCIVYFAYKDGLPVKKRCE